MKANLYESSRFQLNRTEKTTEKQILTLSNRATIVSTYEEQYKLTAQKTFFSNLASRQMKTENKALLFFLGLEVQFTAEFKLLAIPYNPLGYCFRFDLQCLKIL